MVYFDKIIENTKILSLPSHVSVTIPHQSFTPRQILEQFVINDLQVMSHDSSDYISVPDGDCDIDSVDNAIMDFEDEFQAHSFVKNDLPRIRKQQRDESIRKQKELEAQKAAVVAAEVGNKEGTLPSQNQSSVVSEPPPAPANS